MSPDRAHVFPHPFARDPLFGDEGLAGLLDSYPDHLFDINIYDFEADGAFALRTGVRGRLPGAELLKAIKGGRLWVNLRDFDAVYPELWRSVERALRDICAQTGSAPPRRAEGHLIISSPQAKVPYHFDAAGVVLFHLRGRKRMWVYPTDEGHLPEASMEKVVLRQTTEEIPYAPSFDAAAQVFDLEAGQVIAWPHYAPHRIENLGVFNVSLSVEYQTWATRLRNGALYTNGLMRRAGARPRPTRILARPGLAVGWAMSLALKKLPLSRSRLETFERSFEPAVDALDGAAPLIGRG